MLVRGYEEDNKIKDFDHIKFDPVPKEYFEINGAKAQKIRQEIRAQNKKKREEKDQQDEHKDR